MPTIKSESFLMKWYIMYSVLISFVVIKVVCFPVWPNAKPLAKAQLIEGLSSSGLKPFTTRVLPGFRNYEYSSSPTLVFSSSSGYELSLFRAKVRQRLNLSLTFIASQEPHKNILRPPEDRTTQSRNKRFIMDNSTIQTCYVEGSGFPDGFATHTDSLTTLVDLRSDRFDTILQRVIGLQPNRSYDCILVTLVSKKGAPISLDKWQAILMIISENYK